MLTLTTPLDVKTGRVIEETKQVSDLEIVSIQFDQNKIIRAKLAYKKGREVVQEIVLQIPASYIEGDKPGLRQALRYFYNGIKTIPGYDGTVS